MIKINKELSGVGVKATLRVSAGFSLDAGAAPHASPKGLGLNPAPRAPWRRMASPQGNGKGIKKPRRGHFRAVGEVLLFFSSEGRSKLRSWFKTQIWPFYENLSLVPFFV